MSKKEIPREPKKTKLTRAQRKEIDAVIRKYKGDGKPIRRRPPSRMRPCTRTVCAA